MEKMSDKYTGFYKFKDLGGFFASNSLFYFLPDNNEKTCRLKVFSYGISDLPRTSITYPLKEVMNMDEVAEEATFEDVAEFYFNYMDFVNEALNEDFERIRKKELKLEEMLLDFNENDREFERYIVRKSKEGLL